METLLNCDKNLNAFFQISVPLLLKCVSTDVLLVFGVGRPCLSNAVTYQQAMLALLFFSVNY